MLKLHYNSSEAYVFEKLPSNPLTSMIMNSTHLNAPYAAKNEILKWIEQLVPFF
jgi:hypothetical protein